MRSPRTHTQSTSEDRSRRRRAIALVLVGALLLTGWILGIAVLAGGDSGGGSGGNGSGREPEQRSGTPARGEARGEHAGDGAAPDDGSSRGSSGGPSKEELEEAASETLSEPPGGGAPEGEVPIEDEEGRSNGQRGFVASFVGAAYGYTGKDVEEYRAGYESRIDPDTYYDSAGGEVLEEYATLVEDGGAENAAILEEYRITSGEPVQTEVDVSELAEFAPRRVAEGPMPEGASVSEVTYAVGERYGDPSKGEDFGKVYGEVDYLGQRLFLSREGGGWKIVAAGAPQQTKAPERPDPDAPKVIEPGGPGVPDHH